MREDHTNESLVAGERLDVARSNVAAAERLSTAQTYFVYAIRQAQKDGMTPDDIQQIILINDKTYAALLVAWDLDT